MGKLKEISLEEQAEKILELAEERGIASNFFFATTFKRYRTQLQSLDLLEKAIWEHGSIVKKEYVKGRENIVVNPAITEFNKTTTAANNTVATLINIINKLEREGESDELLNFLGFAK